MPFKSNVKCEVTNDKKESGAAQILLMNMVIFINSRPTSGINFLYTISSY